MKRGKYKTNLENVFENALIKENINYVYDYSLRTKYGYRIDFALVELKIGIECDGECWHLLNNLHDKRRDVFFKSIGWKIVRFKGVDILSNIDKCINKLKEVISNEENKNYLKRNCTIINEQI